MIMFDTASGDKVLIVDDEHLSDFEQQRLLAMASPEAKPVLTAAFEQCAKREADFMAQATPEQNQIGWGDPYYIKVRLPLGGKEVTVYGLIMTEAAFARAERAAGAGDAEVAVSVATVKEGYSRGWRYGMCFSQAVPEGETGTYHVAQITRMPYSQFEVARALGWPDEVPA